MPFENVDPIVVGGLGGSGTRVVSAVLQRAGMYGGDCQNDSLDNLWFTLLFRRPASIKTLDEVMKMDASLAVFHQRMHGVVNWDLAERKLLRNCAWEFVSKNYVRNSRIGFPLRVYRSFFKDNVVQSRTWGWKEPNAHIFLPLLLKKYPNMRYIHVMRHPLDIVYSSNKLQLRNWKHLFGIDERNEQLASVQFYKAANERVMLIGKGLGEKNFMVLKLEEICHQPVENINRLLEFCNMQIDKVVKEELYRIPTIENVKTNYTQHDNASLQPTANEVASLFGYNIV